MVFVQIANCIRQNYNLQLFQLEIVLVSIKKNHLGFTEMASIGGLHEKHTLGLSVGLI